MLPFLLLFASLTTLLFMFIVALRRKTHSLRTTNYELFDLVSRYRFFQGKNLETFSRLLNANNPAGIEQLIREKFEAQQKPNAQTLAQNLFKKLRS